MDNTTRDQLGLSPHPRSIHNAFKKDNLASLERDAERRARHVAIAIAVAMIITVLLASVVVMNLTTPTQ